MQVNGSQTVTSLNLNVINSSGAACGFALGVPPVTSASSSALRSCLGSHTCLLDVVAAAILIEVFEVNIPGSMLHFAL